MLVTRPNSISLRDALLFHVLFFALAVPLASYLHGDTLGRAVLLLTAVYNLALPLVARVRRHPQWYQLWIFLLPLSATLPAADWLMVKRMGTLVFPNHGVPRLGGVVPVYFPGLWIMLLWPVTLFASAVRRSYIAAGALALVLFTTWEWAARPLELWQARDVRMFHGFALYPLIPEALLAMATVWMWRTTFWLRPWQRVIGALGVSVFYAGALSLALLWIK